MKKQKHFYGWYLVAALWLIYFFNIGFPMYGGTVLNSYMVDQLGISRTVLGLGFSLFSLCQGLPGPLISRMIERRGQRFTMGAGTLMIAASAILMAWAVRSAAAFVLVFGVLGGVGVGFATVVPIQTTVTLWFEKKRSMALAITLTASGFGGFLASPVLTAVMERWGSWRVGWMLVAAVALLALILIVLFVRNRPSDLGQRPDGAEGAQEERTASGEDGARWSVREAAGTKSLWMIFIAALGFYVPYMMMVSHGLVYLIDCGINSRVASMSVGVITLSSVAGRLLSGWLGQKKSPRLVLGASLFLTLAATLLLALGRTSATALAYSVLLGVGFGAAFVCVPGLVSGYFGAASFAGLYGSLMPLLTVFSSLSPFMAGKLYDVSGSYTAAFGIAMAVNAVGLLCSTQIRPPQRRI